MGLLGGISRGLSKINDPGADGISFVDKLYALGATMQGDTSTALDLRRMAAERMKEAAKLKAQEEFLSAFMPQTQVTPTPDMSVQRSPQLPQTAPIDTPMLSRLPQNRPIPSPGMNGPLPPPLTVAPPPISGINDPKLLPFAMRMSMNGVNVTPALDILKAQQPEMAYGPGGLPYNRRDPNLKPQAKVGEGQLQLYDAQGNPYVVNASGYVQSAAEAAGAVEGAKARANAPYQDVTVKGPGGQDITMSREAFASKGRFEGPTPAQNTYNVDAAKAQVERDFTRPKAEAALSALNAKTKVVDEAIGRALGMVGNWSAGMGAGLARIPGTQARDLQAELETIKANIGFDELQTMRDNSPTGGALGQVAVQELEALRATLANLDQEQSPAQLKAMLKRVQEIRKGAQTRREQAFRSTYEPGRAAATMRPDRAAVAAELKRRGLLP